jgi:FAD-dependent oxidoreductase domain-containing protein 1
MAQTADVVLIGGGIIGASIAYHLRQDGFSGRILVIERDTTYARAATPMSLGGVRQLYGVPSNIQLARYSLQFYERFDELMSGRWGQAQAHFHQRGYLLLLDDQNRDAWFRRYEVQRQMGVEVQMLPPGQVHELFPHLYVGDVTYALFSQRDGYVNPRGALQGFVERSRELNCTWLQDEVIGFEAASGQTFNVQTRTAETISAPVLVIVSGAWAQHVAGLAGISLPVQPVRRQACYVTLARPLGYKLPMVIDRSDVHFRHDTETDNHLLISYIIRDEPPGFNFDWDSSQFEAHILPTLKRRLPACGDVQLQRGWAGHYAVTPDENPILGPHPEFPGLFMATGYSGHGVMLAPASGKVLSEVIRLGRYETLDATPYRLERFATGELISDPQI